jgi:hypothetical protein
MSIKTFKNFNEKKDMWIKDAISKPGSLRKELGKKKGEEITKKEIDTEISKLKKKDKDTKKPGTQFNKKDASKLKKLNLAKTLRKMNEDLENGEFDHEDINLNNTKLSIIEEIIEMDETEINQLLSVYDWSFGDEEEKIENDEISSSKPVMPNEEETEDAEETEEIDDNIKKFNEFE